MKPSISLVDPDHAEHFYSLDDVYYFGGQSGHQQIAILDHRPSNDNNQEIELKIGDIVGIA
uniref:Uncharacterized protein n=1 Tax=Romanomermis culicivorax TaxID=13658 RepID=A0A915IQ09_ROMCU